MVTVIIFLDDRNNCKQYSAEKVCDTSLRAHYLLYYSMCLQILIYYFFLCSFTILSFSMWELEVNPALFGAPDFEASLVVSLVISH